MFSKTFKFVENNVKMFRKKPQTKSLEHENQKTETPVEC